MILTTQIKFFSLSQIPATTINSKDPNQVHWQYQSQERRHTNSFIAARAARLLLICIFLTYFCIRNILNSISQYMFFNFYFVNLLYIYF